jgi:5-hydroxyisourate hydrolase
MGRLTTHVLDTAHGRPGDGIAIDLYRIGGTRERLTGAVTNKDGRCDKPLLEGDSFLVGSYELVFHVGDYSSTRSRSVSESPTRTSTTTCRC